MYLLYLIKYHTLTQTNQLNPASIANMLVFSLVNLPEIFDILISNYEPVSQPLSKRTLPANVLCYYARFAYHMCEETWLETLIEGAIERIEEGVYVSFYRFPISEWEVV